MEKEKLDKIKLALRASRFAVSRLISDGSHGFLADRRSFISYEEVIEILHEMEREYEKKE